MSTGSKVIAQTDRQTHTNMTKTLPLPHTREVINLTNTKMYLTNTVQLKYHRKYKYCLKVPEFSSIFLKKFRDFSSVFKIPRLFRDWKMLSHFPEFLQSMWKQWLLTTVY